MRKPLGKNLLLKTWTLKKTTTFGGLIENQLVAILSCFDETPRVAHLTAFAVSPLHQGQGYGRDLVNFLKEDLIARGYQEIRVKTRATTKDFYTKCGFVVIGEPDYNEALGIHDYLMHMGLEKE